MDEITATEFANSIVCGPSVTIRISNGNQEYKVPRKLLCKNSPYFSAMFHGSFCESKDQTATLEAVDGVISEQSFEGLLQWLFLGRVTFGHTDPGQLITAFIELARLADMCGIIEPRDYLARSVKEVIAMNDEGTTFSLTRDITSEHISSAGELPEGYPLFRVLCMASVREVLAAQTCKLANESSLCLGYAAGVLEEVMITLKTLRVSSRTQALKPGTKGHVKTSLSCYVDDPINLEKPLIMPGKSLKSRNVEDID